MFNSPRRVDRITLPERVEDLLRTSRSLHGAVLVTLEAFEPWLEDNKLVFFSEYTDHGPDHVRQVIESASALISDEAWNIITAQDMAALVLACLLHDSAMHLSEDGFLSLLTSEPPRVSGFGDASWIDLWRRFLMEAGRFDERKLIALFDEPRPVRIPPHDKNEFTKYDRLLIGEFLRRHHPRLAHEIATSGIPGPPGIDRITLDSFDPRFADLAGLIARSHGMSIRSAVEKLPVAERRRRDGVLAPYIMCLVRIGDYLQIQADRAPKSVLRTRALTSPISRREWSIHRSIADVHSVDDDPEALFVTARPKDVSEFLSLQRLLRSIQQELDESWAVLGQVYGRFAELQPLGLTIRRIKSNFDHVDEFSKHVDYIPIAASFTTATSELLKLLIRPLYGDRPEVGVRELLQNAVDAVRELRDYVEQHKVAPQVNTALPADIVISVETKSGCPLLTIEDRGIGMTVETIVEFFLRAGASFRNSDAWREEHLDGYKSRVLRSGRFGIGALAAFLLGDRIDVSTRHVTSPTGAAFTASIDDESVELKKVDRPVGTTIRVNLSRNASTKLADPNAWDWYCSDDPKIVRTSNRTPLPQRYRWPQSELTPQWRSFRTSSFPEVRWSYWARGPALVCNGIKVENPNMPAFLPRNSPFRVRPPLLSVYDPDGNLPLDLQRHGLIQSVLPFEDALVRDVAKDLIAFVLVHAPAQPRAIFGNQIALGYPALDAITFGQWSWLWMTADGWTIATPDSWTTPPSNLVVLQADAREPIGLDQIDFNRHHVARLYSQPNDVDGGAYWLGTARLATADQPSFRLPPPTGAKAIINAMWFNGRLDRRNDALFSALGDGRIARSSREADWVVISWGRDFETTLDFDAIDRKKAVGDFNAVMELSFDNVTVTRADAHPMTAVWRELLGTASVPYQPAARRRLEQTLELAPYVTAHRALG